MATSGFLPVAGNISRPIVSVERTGAVSRSVVGQMRLTVAQTTGDGLPRMIDRCPFIVM
jgi:hypothetical protein